MELFESRLQQPSAKPAPWPPHEDFAERFCVPDLVPSSGRLRAVFIGESPHRDEVAPKDAALRSPFRGVAGREWWAELVKLAGSDLTVRPVPPRPALESLCSALGIAVMNAVQYPIDPKIVLHQGDSAAPKMHLGFEKGSGEASYKAVFKQGGSNPVFRAIADLAARLQALGDHEAQVVCLGNDSRWFVERALALLPEGGALTRRPAVTIPHPSSWWRNAAYRTRAVQALTQLLG
jgi:hypothetical protein